MTNNIGSKTFQDSVTPKEKEFEVFDDLPYHIKKILWGTIIDWCPIQVLELNLSSWEIKNYEEQELLDFAHEFKKIYKIDYPHLAANAAKLDWNPKFF